MRRPENAMRRAGRRDGLIGAFLYWLGGYEIEDGLTAGLSARELSRIRAKQIDAVIRLIPVTMAVTMLNVAGGRGRGGGGGGGGGRAGGGGARAAAAARAGRA